MATLRQYFETDFSNTIRVHVILKYLGEDIEAKILYDPIAFSAYLSCYISGNNRGYDYLLGLLKSLQYGQAKFHLQGNITLPKGNQFPGELRFENKADFNIDYKLYGETKWRSTRNIKSTTRTYMYSETNLQAEDISRLTEDAGLLGHKLSFRSSSFVERSMFFEKPLAFISHDSRDKHDIAQPIVEYLRKMMCPVWYDEYSLKVGDSLRESIEKGLKKCQKCILILSSNFLSNNGWTKKEFDSIFTRELLEETNLILPVWYKVTKEQVFNYSPSLLNIKGLSWDTLGEEEVSRLLYRAIID